MWFYLGFLGVPKTWRSGAKPKAHDIGFLDVTGVRVISPFTPQSAAAEAIMRAGLLSFVPGPGMWSNSSSTMGISAAVPISGPLYR
jgi:hypothetical protein